MDRYDADLGDDRLFHNLEQRDDLPPEAKTQEDKYSLFRWDRYDWSQFDPVAYGYNVVRMGASSKARRKSLLSGVYFTIVDLHHYDAITGNGTKDWYPLPTYAKGDDDLDREMIYLSAYRTEGPRKGQRTVHLHRFVYSLTGKPWSDVVDHGNRYPLDNREANLGPASYRLNMHNREAWQKTSDGRMPWVEWRDRKKTIVGGVYMVDGAKVRSPDTWPIADQIRAYEWACAERAKLYPSDSPLSRVPLPLPQLPPLLVVPDFVPMSTPAVADNILATF